MQQASKPCSKIVNFRTKNFALAIHDPTVLVLYEFQCIQKRVLHEFAVGRQFDRKGIVASQWYSP